MLFNSAAYGAFLLAAYVVFWALRRRTLLRPLFLTVASYGFYFYGTWEAATEQEVPLGPLGWSALCLAIIFVGSSLDFYIGKALGRTESPGRRKALLLASVVYYLGVLSVFKYFNFAVDSFATVASWAGVPVSPVHLRLVLPFGISFFTFETMSYTIDVYRREIPPADRYLDYLLFVCFFPHLVAGPIVRPRTMLPQLAAMPVATDERKAHGLYLIATGLLKKIVIGDVLSINLVNRVFDNPERYSSLEVLVAVYGYAIKIYADFSGYSDVAIGSAHLFGYELPKNFDAPYISQSVQEFWRRWHMSLSAWLRDYLYISLGGSRRGPWMTYRNLMLTMLLGGLWHGASWNFVIWGGLHGGGLALERAVDEKRVGKMLLVALPACGLLALLIPARAWAAMGATVGVALACGVMLGALKHRSGAPMTALRVVIMFHFACLCWIFFRAPTFDHAILVLGRLAKLSVGTANLAPKVLAALAVGLVAHALPKKVDEAIRDAFVKSPALVQGIALAVCAYIVHFAMGAKSEPFVYGQF